MRPSLHSRLRTARRRDRLWRLAQIAIVCALGLGSRRFGGFLPGFIASYAGDVFWPLAAFLGIGLVLSQASTARVAGLALVVSILVEVSQLYHAPWIDAIRARALGGLLLGFGFLWTDLVCYAAGVGVGVVFELAAYTAAPPPIP